LNNKERKPRKERNNRQKGNGEKGKTLFFYYIFFSEIGEKRERKEYINLFRKIKHI
jgi:hypothetical protein